jgi:hypothetical protein
MGNHYHLLLRTPEPNLAQGMRQLNGVYAQRFNRKRGRVGHVLQGRYGARLVQQDRHLRATVRYVVRNPVGAGLCTSPRGWRYSSHLATLGEATSGFFEPSRVLEYYGPTPQTAVARYSSHTEETGDEELSGHPLTFGDEGFVERTLSMLEPTPGVPARYARKPRPSLEPLLHSRDDAAIARAAAHGYSLREIGGYLGCHASTVSRRLRAYRARERGATRGT